MCKCGNVHTPFAPRVFLFHFFQLAVLTGGIGQNNSEQEMDTFILDYSLLFFIWQQSIAGKIQTETILRFTAFANQMLELWKVMILQTKLEIFIFKGDIIYSPHWRIWLHHPLHLFCSTESDPTSPGCWVDTTPLPVWIRGEEDHITTRQESALLHVMMLIFTEYSSSWWACH